MRRATCLVLVCGLVAIGCGRSSSSSPPDGQITSGGTELGDHTIGEPLRFENLAIFPVASKQPMSEDRFITLDEGLKAGTVEIREQGSDGRNAAANTARPNPPAANPPVNQPPPNAPAPQGQASAAPRQAVPAPAPGQAPAQQQLEANRNNDAPPQGQQAARQGGGASVNQLVVINSSGKPLYLMPGEVIIGGQQDRTIGEETIIASTGQPVPLKVFCVEHGRWQQRDVAANVGYLETLQAGESQQLSKEQLAKLAEEANSGKFVKSAGQVNKDLRLAVQGHMEQGKVWEEVANLNARNGAKNDSGAFTENYGGKDLAAKLDPYLNALQQQVSERANVVGVVVAVNGKVQAVDIFESTPLFKKLWPKLLKSYALDAVASRDGAAQKDCTVADACNFVKEATEAKVEKTDGNANVAITRRETSSVASFTCAAKAAAPSAVDPSPEAKPVHTSAFAK